MSDILDRARDLEQHARDAALADVRARLPAGPSLSHCSECGDDIPVARQQAVPGCKTCVHCQHVRERGRS